MAVSLLEALPSRLHHQQLNTPSKRSHGTQVICFSMHDFTRRAGKFAFVTIAATVLVAGVADARPRARFGASDEEIKQYMEDPTLLTYDQEQQRAYLDAKGKGTGSKCPEPVNAGQAFGFEPGSYSVRNMCLQPKSYRVTRKAGVGDFDVSTTFVTSLDTRVDGIEGSLVIDPEGGLSFEESKENMDTAVEQIIARLPGKEELIPFMFGMQELVASGKPDSFGGQFQVPNTFLFPEDATSEEQQSLTADSPPTTTGNVVFKVTSSNPETKELYGEFETRQLSGVDFRSKSDGGFKIGNGKQKGVKVEGIWYAKLE